MSRKSNDRKQKPRPPTRLDLLRSESQAQKTDRLFKEIDRRLAERNAALQLQPQPSTSRQDDRPPLGSPPKCELLPRRSPSPVQSCDISPSLDPIPEPESPDSRFWTTRFRLSRPLTHPAPRRRCHPTHCSQGVPRLNSDRRDSAHSRANDVCDPSTFAEKSTGHLPSNSRDPSSLHDHDSEN